MIKHVATFAIVILGLAVFVADPGTQKSAESALPAPQPAPQSASAEFAGAAPAPAVQAAPEVDPSWYGDAAGEAGQMPAAGSAADDGYNISPARAVPAARTAARAAPAPAPQAAEYVPPPPPPQVPPGS